MKTKLILGGFAVFLVAVIALWVGERFFRTVDRDYQAKEIRLTREVGIHLFMYANDHGGNYPSSLDLIEKAIEDEDLKLFLKNPRLSYIPPTKPANEVSQEQYLLVYHYSDAGNVVYTLGNSAMFVKLNK